MEEEWSLWELFPGSINPFYFNDTVAGLIWWFEKEEVMRDWYLWRKGKIKIDIPEQVEVIETSELSNYEWFDTDWVWKVNPDILDKTIVDKQWNYYRIVKM